jgi:hypothetical protein
MPIMYSIHDPEFCSDEIIPHVSLLTPGAIQRVSQRIAGAPPGQSMDL